MTSKPCMFEFRAKIKIPELPHMNTQSHGKEDREESRGCGPTQYVEVRKGGGAHRGWPVRQHMESGRQKSASGRTVLPRHRL